MDTHIHGRKYSMLQIYWKINQDIKSGWYALIYLIDSVNLI